MRPKYLFLRILLLNHATLGLQALPKSEQNEETLFTNIEYELQFYNGWQQGIGFLTYFRFSSSFKQSDFGGEIRA